MSGAIEPVGLISEPIGNVATEQPGTAIFPSTAFEGQDWFGLSNLLARSVGDSQAEYGTSDEYGRPLGWLDDSLKPEPASVPAAEANKALPGQLSFTAPIQPSVLQSMVEAKHDELARADAAARTPPGFWPGAARLGAGFVAGLLDPPNLVGLLVPALGEVRLAGILARAGLPGLTSDVLADMAQPMVGLFGGVAEAGARAIPSLGARLAVRGLTGAAGGVEYQAPLTALRYGLSRQEQGDYSAMDALGDVIMMGAGLGAAGHAGLGAIGDLFGERFARSAAGAAVADDPATAEAAMRASVAQMVDGRPVEVGPVLEAGRMASYVRDANARAVVMARTASLQREADALRAEADQVPGFSESVESPESMIRPPVPDAATQGRIDAVLDELTDPANPPSAGRRAQLLDEHRMLSQGAAPGNQLEQARSEAQRQGLLTAAGRIEDRIRALRDAQPDDAGGDRASLPGQPVAQISGGEIAPHDADLKTLRRAAREFYERVLRGTSVRSEALGRDVEFRGSRKAFSASANPDKLRLFAALRDVIAKGTLASSELPREPALERSTKAYHFLTASVEMDGKPVRVGVTVREDANGHLYYNHNPIRERGAPPPGTEDTAHEAGPGTEGGATRVQNVGVPENDVNLRSEPEGGHSLASPAAQTDTGGTFDRALDAAHGAPSPEETATARMADAAAREAKPDLPSGIPAALETQLADVRDALARADAAGLLGAAEHAEIEAANSWTDQAKSYAQATLQAAACIARGMG